MITLAFTSIFLKIKIENISETNGLSYVMHPDNLPVIIIVLHMQTINSNA